MGYRGGHVWSGAEGHCDKRSSQGQSEGRTAAWSPAVRSPTVCGTGTARATRATPAGTANLSRYFLFR